MNKDRLSASRENGPICSELQKKQKQVRGELRLHSCLEDGALRSKVRTLCRGSSLSGKRFPYQYGMVLRNVDIDQLHLLCRYQLTEGKPVVVNRLYALVIEADNDRILP